MHSDCEFGCAMQSNDCPPENMAEKYQYSLAFSLISYQLLLDRYSADAYIDFRSQSEIHASIVSSAGAIIATQLKPKDVKAIVENWQKSVDSADQWYRENFGTSIAVHYDYALKPGMIPLTQALADIASINSISWFDPDTIAGAVNDTDHSDDPDLDWLGSVIDAELIDPDCEENHTP